MRERTERLGDLIADSVQYGFTSADVRLGDGELASIMEWAPSPDCPGAFTLYLESYSRGVWCETWLANSDVRVVTYDD